LLSKHAQGKNYEPEAALVELRMGYESARRNGATATGERWARPTLSALVSNNQRGRDSGVMGEGSVRERERRATILGSADPGRRVQTVRRLRRALPHVEIETP
jgi:hypothetical protein